MTCALGTSTRQQLLVVDFGNLSLMYGGMGLRQRMSHHPSVRRASLLQCPRSQVLAVEVIWTPQDDGDSYTRDDMMLEFPKMVTL